MHDLLELELGPDEEVVRLVADGAAAVKLEICFDLRDHLNLADRLACPSPEASRLQAFANALGLLDALHSADVAAALESGLLHALWLPEVHTPLDALRHEASVPTLQRHAHQECGSHMPLVTTRRAAVCRCCCRCTTCH